VAFPVDIYVTTDDTLPVPVPGATVGLYDPTTYAEIGVSTTDIHGRASFLTIAEGNYEVRSFLLGFRFLNPTLIQVTDPGPNVFTQLCTSLALSAAADPAMCRCTGRFMGLDNQPLAGVSVRVEALVDTGAQTPKIVNGNVLSAEIALARTNSDGEVVFDLPRNGQFHVTYAGDEDNILDIKVPDRPSASLTELMFPVPVLLLWNQDDAPSNNVSVAAGAKVTVRWTMVYSDFEVLSTGIGWLQFENMNPDTAIIRAGDGQVEISGMAAGSTVLSGSTVQPEDVIQRQPPPVIQIPSLSITVTP
jgi:hypothetical protein